MVVVEVLMSRQLLTEIVLNHFLVAAVTVLMNHPLTVEVLMNHLLIVAVAVVVAVPRVPLQQEPAKIERPIAEHFKAKKLTRESTTTDCMLVRLSDFVLVVDGNLSILAKSPSFYTICRPFK
jgi:hypothetical protein